MKTVVDKLAHKYALNINQIRGPAKTKNLDFKNLNKGFYDDIAKNDIKIKKDQKELKKLKDISLKEFIYTNKEIPEKWRKKSNYEDDLLSLMVNDTNILRYVGTSPREQNVRLKTYSDKPDKKLNIKNNISVENEKNFPSINNRYINKKMYDKNNTKREEENALNNIYDSNITKRNTITEEQVDDIAISRLIKNKSRSKIKSQLNDKAINNILEDFKAAYPIKEKLQQLHSTTKYNNMNKNNILNELNNDIKYNTNTYMTMTTRGSLKNISNNNKVLNDLTNNGKNYFYNSLKNQQQFKRKNVFRQNVFNNLVSNNAYSTDNKSPEKKPLKSESYNKIKPLVGTDYQSFIKKVEITNPIINKNLESINFYGPYFSHCPPCYNRNLDYYKNLEANQCLEIIHHIKKMRMKNTLLDIKKSINTEENKPNLENNLCLDSESIKSDQYNS
jgi:hypothetical protein